MVKQEKKRATQTRATRTDTEQKAAEMREKLRQQAEERAAAARSRTYEVKPGDTLSKIAKQVLGDANRWPEIFEANKDQIKDPNLIHPGQELRIPS